MQGGWRKGGRWGERGSNLIEFALTLPLLLWIMFGVFDLGRAVFAQNVISNAAREGARYAIIYPEDTDGIVQRVEAAAFGLDLNDLAVEVNSTLTTVTVSVTYSFTAVTPLIGILLGEGGTMTLQAASTMNIEGAQ